MKTPPLLQMLPREAVSTETGRFWFSGWEYKYGEFEEGWLPVRERPYSDLPAHIQKAVDKYAAKYATK